MSLAEAGASEGLEAKLEAVTSASWNQPGLSDAASVLESAETALLLLQSGAKFELTWTLAEQRRTALDFSFPSVWPNPDKLLARCTRVGGFQEGAGAAQVIEDARPERSKALAELIRAARMAIA